jgi:hypothetical protein
MKEYLLGRLPTAEADAIEDRYFADSEFLSRLEDCERRLIADYLKGHISATDRELFEQRYLAIPELRRRLDAHRVEVNNRWRQPWRLVLVPLAVVLICAGIYWVLSPQLQRPSAGDQSHGSTVSALVATLSPGVTKGEGKEAAISLPRKEAIITLRLEITAADKSDPLSASLDRFDGNGQRTRVYLWDQPLKSERATYGYWVPLELKSTLLQHADYIVTLRSPDGAVLEAYVFRAK